MTWWIIPGLLFLFYILRDMGNVKSIASSPQEFKDLLFPLAQEFENLYGIKKEIIITHAALETDWGRRTIDNNLFNIKKGLWKGPTVKVTVKEYDPLKGWYVATEEFRAYSTLRDSIQDYINFIQSRYPNAWRNRKNPKKYFEELQKGGYATDPLYAYKLTRIYENLV